VTNLFAAAQELPPGERVAFLDRECGGDAELRREVETLLAAGREAGGFFNSLAYEAIPQALAALVEPVGGRVGRTIGGYEVVEELGRGGMGVVYRAEDRRLRRPVALTFPHDPVLADRAARARLLDEARAASGLDDPNICTIFELAETPEGETFFAMAYYAGETLAQRLKRGPIPLADAWQIAVGITRGLAAAHAKGIVHRDLTPRNIMLPARDTVKILDFGLAGAVEAGSMAGTPAYMPPELILGDPTGKTGDVWSLGVTLYELFTGQRPFTGDTSTVPEAVLTATPTPPRKLNGRIPEALDRLILQMLEKDPAERPADAGAVREALEPILERARSRRTRLLLTAAVSLIALLVTGLLATRGPATPAIVPSARIVFLPIAYDSTRRVAVYLAAGLRDALSRELGRIRGIALISWTGGPAEDAATPRARRRLGQALNAGSVLEGRVAGDDSVTLRLHDTRDDRVLWTSTLDFRKRNDVTVGRELAVEIARALRVAAVAGTPVESRRGVLARDPATGHVYEAVPGTVSWYDAERAAEARTYQGTRGHLATITSAAEDRFVWENLKQAVVGGYWLGGFKALSGVAAREGWSWVTDEPFAYTNWVSGNPNDYFGEDGLQYWPAPDAEGWNDIDRIVGFEPFVGGFRVEYEP
jgi:serine/threonine-protein kinase